MSFDLFEFYRFMLAALVGIYGTIRLVTFIWRWQGPTGHDWVGSALAHRYLSVLLLRMRFRRFLFELATNAALLVILGLLVRAHFQ